ncbi:MAG: hypothetical protein M3T56_11065, partial [Chloroflexota bacterium]|nr:hypothetical protein [Chloroflexota bacterium]
MPLVAGATVESSRAMKGLPGEAWAVSVGHLQVSQLRRPLLAKLRENGINTLVVDPADLSTRQLNQIRAAGNGSGFSVLTPISSPQLGLFGPPGAASAMCRAEKARHPGRLCSVRASLATAVKLARESDVDAVVAYVRGPDDLRYLRGIRGNARLLAIAKLGSRVDLRAWRRAMETAHGDSVLELGIAPAAFRGTKQLDWYLGLLRSMLRRPGKPPSTPRPPSVWVSPSGNDSTCVRGNSSKPCATFDKAYDIASSGAVVEVGCGGASTYSYDGQTITPAGGAAKTDYVTFRPASGCAPQVGRWTELTADWIPRGSTWGTPSTTITVQSTAGFKVGQTISVASNSTSGVETCTGMTATQFTGCSGGPDATGHPLYYGPGTEVVQSSNLTIAGADWVKIDGISAGSPGTSASGTNYADHVRFVNGSSISFGVVGGSDVTYQNWAFGPKRGSRPNFVTNDSTGHGPDNVTFDHDTFTDINSEGCHDSTNFTCHDDSLYIRYADGFTFTNNRATGYSQFLLYFTEDTSSYGCRFPCRDNSLARNVVIRNNFFGASWQGGLAIMFDRKGNHAVDNYLIEHNTFVSRNRLSNARCTAPQTPCPFPTNFIMRANYGHGNFSCASELPGSITYKFNVWVDQ